MFSHFIFLLKKILTLVGVEQKGSWFWILIAIQAPCQSLFLINYLQRWGIFCMDRKCLFLPYTFSIVPSCFAAWARAVRTVLHASVMRRFGHYSWFSGNLLSFPVWCWYKYGGCLVLNLPVAPPGNKGASRWKEIKRWRDSRLTFTGYQGDAKITAWLDAGLLHWGGQNVKRVPGPGVGADVSQGALCECELGGVTEARPCLQSSFHI